ncbi:MAG: NAD(P)/FAD-dependent oxidoreductase [Pseudomonadota bacterium]
MAIYDHIIIGSGINALVCAAVLSERQTVLVVEREGEIGGTMRSDTLAPGFTYDPMAATFLLFHAGPAFGALEGPLARAGATFSTTQSPTGVLTREGRALVLGKDRAENAARFDALHPGDGAAYLAEMGDIDANAELLFGLLGTTLLSGKTAQLLAKSAIKSGIGAVKALIGEALISNRRRLQTTYGSDLVEALFAPWPLHAGLNPEQPFSGKMGAVMAYALEGIGAPIATGGAAKVPEALKTLIEKNDGIIRTNADADEIIPGTDGRDVAGLRLVNGEALSAPSVICCVTPTQLYGRLLRNWDIPAPVARGVARYGYGKGNMQIHYALERPVAWPDAALGDVQLLHLADGIDSVSKATNEAERGLLPERPTVCIGQPTAADKSRAPEGKAVLWLQLPECPRTLKGDAAGEIETPADGRWTEAVREAYADRVEAMIAAHVPDFQDTIIARKAYAPHDLEAMNMNLVGGDPYAGWCGLDQFFVFRPLPTQTNHKTFVPGVHHIGASTHPGPGLSGTSGWLVAKALQPRARW